MATLAPVRLYNSLTRQVELLEPITPGRVTIYTCGSTVYRYAHIGNLRTYLFGDLPRFGRLDQQALRELRTEARAGETELA
jgi:cysteinyl-tRNA synthetase